MVVVPRRQQVQNQMGNTVIRSNYEKSHHLAAKKISALLEQKVSSSSPYLRVIRRSSVKLSPTLARLAFHARLSFTPICVGARYAYLKMFVLFVKIALFQQRAY